VAGTIVALAFVLGPGRGRAAAAEASELRHQPAAAPLASVTTAVPPALTAELHLRDALLLALRGNRDIQVAVLEARSAHARIAAARGEFDPTIFTEAVRGHLREPVATVPVGEAETFDTRAEVGVRERLQTGTEFELAGSSDYGRDRSGATPLDPHLGTAVAVRLSQDLLQGFGWTTNRIPIVVAQQNWEIAELSLRDRVMQVLFEVEKTYWDLSFATADLAVREQQLARAQRLVTSAETRVAVGEAPPIEITRAKSSAASQAVAILNARNQVTRLHHRLLRLLGVLAPDKADTALGVADSPPAQPGYQTTFEAAMRIANQARPDLAQARLALANAELLQRLAGNRVLPRLQLFGAWTRRGLDEDWGGSVESLRDDGYDTWEAGLRLECPWPNRTARARHAIAALDCERAARYQEATTERAVAEVADAVEDVQAAEGRMTSAAEARALAAQLLEAEEKSFSLGRSDSLDVLNAQAAFASAERDEVRARTDYATALAALFRAQGDFLSQRGIAFSGSGAAAEVAPTSR
jgi:outer membrane protein TolC